MTRDGRSGGPHLREQLSDSSRFPVVGSDLGCTLLFTISFISLSRLVSFGLGFGSRVRVTMPVVAVERVTDSRSSSCFFGPTVLMWACLWFRVRDRLRLGRSAEFGVDEGWLLGDSRNRAEWFAEWF